MPPLGSGRFLAGIETMFEPYLSEIRFRGNATVDFAEVALDNGSDPSVVQVVVYNPNGTVRSTNSLSATPDATVAGTDVYTVSAGIHRNGAVALVVDGTIVQFLSFNRTVNASEGPADGTSSTALGDTANGESLETTDMGQTYSVQTNPNPGTVPCFVAGTLIDTPGGQRSVEDLAAGDVVETVDAGQQALVWTGKRRLNATETRDTNMRPIRFPAGCLGPGCPSSDVLLSPNHRVLLSDSALELLFFETDVLLPAQHLVGWRGIDVALDVPAPEYVHLLFSSHQLVRSHGLVSESFHPLQQGLAGYSAETRAELLELFPGLNENEAAYGPTRRYCLTATEAKVALSCLSA